MSDKQLVMSDKWGEALFVPLWTCILILLLLAGCDRRDLTYYTEAEIELTADWNAAGLDEAEQTSGATAIFYPQDGSAPKVVPMGDRSRKTVRLREGRYDVILFNRSFNDFSGIAFRGEDSYHTLEAYAVSPTEAPDELAADRIENFEVTSGMLGNYSPGVASRGNKSTPAISDGDACHLYFTPRKLTRKITAEIHVKGLNNVRTATCTLGGITSSVFLATGTVSGSTVTQTFQLGNPSFLPNSFTEGTLSTTFNVFDFDESQSHEVHFEALLVDGKTTFKEDLTISKIEQGEDNNGNINITIELKTETDVPDVKPEDGSGSGFDVEVGGWGDDVNTDVPI